jgi:hypothetical protein
VAEANIGTMIEEGFIPVIGPELGDIMAALPGFTQEMALWLTRLAEFMRDQAGIQENVCSQVAEMVAPAQAIKELADEAFERFEVHYSFWLGR